ncbi:hypothetical protein B0T16DRAFT_494787 [Cercophora newfieldiana]|uniref:Uncharacterized protein n=1 Tax=Cercophora newfieldiana TaxID=92897 RepID=A0AA40CNI6_9PEZI|nr:hypothetical protein B0T16DRAFT_494787 [Cercophora newfieldiana]
MQLSLATLLFAAAGFVSALPQNNGLVARQNQNRPVPQGQCCAAGQSLKQDTCNASNGQQGRCVPGGNNCGSALSCVAQSSLTCDNNVIERGKSLCRANFPGGGFFDGANRITNLNQATVN